MWKVTDSGWAWTKTSVVADHFYYQRRTRHRAGTRHGLRMMHAAHNAEIEMERPWRKDTFRLRFPVPAPHAEASLANPGAMPPRLRILSVDDNPLLINRSAMSWRPMPRRVTANGGQEASTRSARPKTQRTFRSCHHRSRHARIGWPQVASAIKNDSPSTR